MNLDIKITASRPLIIIVNSKAKCSFCAATVLFYIVLKQKQSQWILVCSELYPPSDRRDRGG